MKLITRPVVLACTAILTAHASAQTYDAAKDFGTANNPAGPWSYGSLVSLGAAFTLLPEFIAAEDHLFGLDTWHAPGADFPSVGINNQTIPLDWGVNHLAYVCPEELVMHPGIPVGGSIQYSVLRFTAQKRGEHAIDAAFRGTSGDGDLSSTSDIHILVDGVELWSGAIEGHGDTASYSAVACLDAGDTVDVVVGYGSNFANYGDHIGARLVIERRPCPADLNDDGTLSVFDFLLYMNLFSEACRCF